MGQKVNFNKKGNKKPKMGLICILIFIVAIVFLVNFVKKIKNSNINSGITESESRLEIKTTSDYKSLEEIFENYESSIISKSETKDLLSIKANLKHKLYENNQSNEYFFTRLCNAISIFKKFKNFEIIDASKDIKIEVTCNGGRISELKINGDKNYFLNQDSIRNRNLSENITKFSIQSQELQSLIDNDWDETKMNFGTRESTCDGYNIYFDEGIKYKVVSRKIFNVIFSSKYEGQVAGTLSVNSTQEQVVSALGEPNFKEDESIYGYFGEKNYLFFDFLNKEISVYPIVKVNSEDEKNLKDLIKKMNENQDVKEFTTELFSMWTDYDVYDYDSTFVDLRYTLKGFQVSIDSRNLKNGLYIYQNYSGNRNITDLDNVYIKDTDLVFEKEKERAIDDMINRAEQGDYTEEELAEMGTKFSVRSKSYDNGKLRNVLFYSRDRELPDTELERGIEVSSWKWYDEYNFIYSVDEEGIFVFNVMNNENSKLADIDGEININSVGNEKIIYNNTEEININVEY